LESFSRGTWSQAIPNFSLKLIAQFIGNGLLAAILLTLLIR
jgi:hypothetical protein